MFGVSIRPRAVQNAAATRPSSEAIQRFAAPRSGTSLGQKIPPLTPSIAAATTGPAVHVQTSTRRVTKPGNPHNCRLCRPDSSLDRQPTSLAASSRPTVSNSRHTVSSRGARRLGRLSDVLGSSRAGSVRLSLASAFQAVDAEVLDLEELLDAVSRALAPGAGFFRSAEWGSFVGDEPGIDPDDAEFECFRDAP